MKLFFAVFFLCVLGNALNIEKTKQIIEYETTLIEGIVEIEIKYVNDDCRVVTLRQYASPYSSVHFSCEQFQTLLDLNNDPNFFQRK